MRNRGLTIFVLGTIFVTISMILSTLQSVTHIIQNQRATTEVNAWLEGMNYQVVSVNVNDKVVIATIEGSGDMKSIQKLAGQLAGGLNRPVLVNLRTLQAQVIDSGSP
jgi:hypothetical protein